MQNLRIRNRKLRASSSINPWILKSRYEDSRRIEILIEAFKNLSSSGKPKILEVLDRYTISIISKCLETLKSKDLKDSILALIWTPIIQERENQRIQEDSEGSRVQ